MQTEREKETKQQRETQSDRQREKERQRPEVVVYGEDVADGAVDNQQEERDKTRERYKERHRDLKLSYMVKTQLPELWANIIDKQQHTRQIMP